MEPADWRVADGPLLSVLEETGIERIHQNALRVLAQTGLVIHDREAARLLEGAGAAVQPQNGHPRVTIPGEVIEDAISKAPSVVTLYNRMGEEAMVLGGGRLHVRTSSGATAILDESSGAPREATSRDAANAIRLTDALPNVDGVSTLAVQPTDVPADTVDVYAVRLALKNTIKPLGYVCLNESLVEPVVAMAAAAVGGKERLRERPVITALAESTSPLRLVASQVGVLKRFASHGLPLTLHAHPMAGLTSPVTLAGELVVTHAEVLALIAIAQLVRPGTPVVYGVSSSVPDMRTAANLSGAVEVGLLGAAGAQLARRCGVPSIMSSGTDALRPGAQSVMERLMTLLPPALAGVDLVNLSTLETKMSFSLDQLVVDDVLTGMVQRCLRGVEVRDSTLALDVIQRAGPTGSFVSEDHTLEHHREELLMCDLIHHLPRDAWHETGCPDLLSEARKKAKQLLREHHPPALPNQIVAQLDDIVEAVRDNGRPLW